MQIALITPWATTVKEAGGALERVPVCDWWSFSKNEVAFLCKSERILIVEYSALTTIHSLAVSKNLLYTTFTR